MLLKKADSFYLFPSVQLINFYSMHLLVRPVCAALLLFGAISQPAFAITNILSNRYDNNRTAANLTETTLSPASVNANSFGKLWSYWVDGAVYTQPLYVQGVTVLSIFNESKEGE